MNIPSRIFGIDTEEALRKYLEESRKKPAKPANEESVAPPVIHPLLIAPEHYLHLPPITHGRHEYGDLYVHLHRLGATPDVTQICQRLNYQIEATATEQNGHVYVGKINHAQAMTLAKELQKMPFNLRRCVDFLKELRLGMLGKKIVRDAAGKDINPAKLSAVYNEITEVRNPWRGEWLSDRYHTKKRKMHVTYDLLNSKGALEEVTESLDDCLMRDEVPGIDLDDWLNRATPQGLPPPDVKKGAIYYWCPQAKYVAGFSAGGNRAGLYCYRDPRGSNAALGVRLSAAGAQKI